MRITPKHLLKHVLALILAGVLISAPAARAACQARDIIDAATGLPLSGIEDMAWDGGEIVMSAHDRRAAFAALAAGRSVPTGNIYALDPAALLSAEPLSAAGILGDGPVLRPHGIDMRGDQLVIVNRLVGRNVKRFSPVVERYRKKGDSWVHRDTLPTGPLCHANDIAIDARGRLFLTNDRRSCHRMGLLWHTVWGTPDGQVALWTGTSWRVLISDIAFANGIQTSELKGSTVLHVAATRGRHMRHFLLTRRSDGLTALPMGRTALPFAPDNLTRSVDGPPLAAGPASLLAYAAYRHGGLGIEKVTSGAQALHGQTIQKTIQIDGAAYSGATVALALPGGVLVAGAFSQGVAWCAAGES